MTPHGHPRDPLSGAELEGKFRACAAAGALPSQATEQAVELLAQFNSLESPVALLRTLEAV